MTEITKAPEDLPAKKASTGPQKPARTPEQRERALIGLEMLRQSGDEVLVEALGEDLVQKPVNAVLDKENGPNFHQQVVELQEALRKNRRVSERKIVEIAQILIEKGGHQEEIGHTLVELYRSLFSLNGIQDEAETQKKRIALADLLDRLFN